MEQIKILIVDDEENIRNVIKEYAKVENYLTKEASDGKEALELIKNEPFDLMVLDIMMPKMDGLTLLKIILSARDEEIDKLDAFERGIDDYLCKPFSPKELMARMKAIIKRTRKEISIYTYKDLVINFSEHTMKIKNQEIKITPKEFEIMTYFIKNKKLAISREQLLNKIWGYDFYGDDRTVDTHIKMLRNNLGIYRNLIVTVRGIGYKFNDEE